MGKHNTHVGENIEYLLRQKNISKSEFARMLYVDVKTVRRWTNEGTFPDKYILDICDALGVSMDILLNVDMSDARTDHWDTLSQNIKSVNLVLERRETFYNYIKSLGIGIDFEYSSLIDGTQIRRPLPDRVIFSLGNSKKITMHYSAFEKFRKDIGLSVFNRLFKYSPDGVFADTICFDSEEEGR